MFDKAKLFMDAKKAQKELANLIIEVEAGEGAVKIQVTGEQKIKKVTIDPQLADFDDIRELERWLEAALNEAMSKSRQEAMDKMKPFMGSLGL